MSENGRERVLVALTKGRDDIDKLLPPSKLEQELAGKGFQVVVLDHSKPGPAIENLKKLCKKDCPDALVVAGPTAFLDHVPQVILLEGSKGLRPVAVNVVERCAWLYRDEDIRVRKALDNIAIGVARALARPVLTYSEAPVNTSVLVLGDGESASLAARNLISMGHQVQVASPGHFGSKLPDGVQVLEHAELKSLHGYAGAFDAVLSIEGNESRMEAGAVVVALEAADAEPAFRGDTDDSRFKVLSTHSVHPAEPGTSLAIILDQDDVETRLTVESAENLAENAAADGSRVFLFFRHMSVHGRDGQARYDRLRKAGVTLVRYSEPPECSARDDKVTVRAKDAVLGDKTIEVTVDQVYLPARTIPAPDSARLAKVLNLPLDQEGYFQAANIRHFPVASPRKGVFFIGSGHQDISSEEMQEEAYAVASEVRALLGTGKMLVPDLLLEHDREKCAMCLTCLRTCGHAAIELNSAGDSLEFLPAACWECGLCASVCPQQAIVRLFNPVKEVWAALDAATSNRQDPVVVFCCSNSAVQALEMAGRFNLRLAEDAVFIEVPCSGHVSQTEVLKALTAGARGVVILGCHSDNCRSVRGSRSARGKTFQVAEDLEAMGLQEKFVQFHGIASNEPFRLADLINSACNTGPGNPVEAEPMRAAGGEAEKKGVSANG